jgi:hypothetical protein
MTRIIFPPKEERRYTRRLDHVFPVEFRFLESGGLPAGEWRQAFTQDVGSGGLCLVVNQLRDEEVARLKNPQTLLELTLHIPVHGQAISAKVRPRWFQCLKTGLLNQYGFGVVYELIEPNDRARLARTIGVRTFVKALAITFWLVLSLGLGTVGFANLRLRYENERLVTHLAENALLQKTLSSDRVFLVEKIDDLEFMLQQADRKVNALMLAYAHLTRE